MKCPHCEQVIDDSSAYCPFCGEAVGQKYCARCGEHLGAASSTARTLVVVLLMLFGIGLIGLQVTRLGRGTAPAGQESQTPYTIASSEETKVGDYTVYSIDIRVDPFAQRPAILAMADGIAQDKLALDPNGVVDMRVFTTKDSSVWEARVVAVDMIKNSSYQLPGSSFEKVGDNLYVEWRR